MEATAPADLTLAAGIHDLLRRRGETLATAESLTGGLVGAVLTAIAGASMTYRGGVVAYATDVKAEVLGVPASLLAERGAVDPDVAAAMASGVKERLGADWGLALTGVAGPDPQDGQPVGTVHIAVAGPDGVTGVVGNLVAGDRDAIRVASCRAALHALYLRLGGGE
ncbi:MAG TPA: CinA family protein [Mycobacteriales bacterium]|jgi:nicotinamide-nucleotide amidase|nr:CinA family protein [Mycobacteriales bacterium]